MAKEKTYDGVKYGKACEENGVTVIRTRQKYVEARRPDGLIVFLDVIDETSPDAQILKMLNAVRIMAKSKADVILAVGMVRGLQVARGYSERYCPETMPSVLRAMRSLIDGGAYKRSAKKKKKLAAYGV